MAKPSTTAKGYGASHQALRKRWKPVVEAGLVRCARCGKLIPAGARWELGHVDGSQKMAYSGPEHFLCNRSAGGKKGAAITNSLRTAQAPTGKRPWSRVWWEPVPDDVVVLGDPNQRTRERPS
jgi:hypothetical protein